METIIHTGVAMCLNGAGDCHSECPGLCGWKDQMPGRYAALPGGDTGRNSTPQHPGRDDPIPQPRLSFPAASLLRTSGSRSPSIPDLDFLTIGLVMDIWTKKGNDGMDYAYTASQEDFDAF